MLCAATQGVPPDAYISQGPVAATREGVAVRPRISNERGNMDETLPMEGCSDVSYQSAPQSFLPTSSSVNPLYIHDRFADYERRQLPLTAHHQAVASTAPKWRRRPSWCAPCRKNPCVIQMWRLLVESSRSTSPGFMSKLEPGTLRHPH